MRKIGIGLGIILVLVIVSVGIFAATFDVNKYRGTIHSELQKRLGRSVNLGDMHLKLFLLRLGVQDLAIADDPRFSPDAPFVKAKELEVSVKLLPLLHKQIEIDSLNLERPSVNLIRNQAGEWNFACVGHPPGIANPAKQAVSAPSKNKPSAKQGPATAPPSEIRSTPFNVVSGGTPRARTARRHLPVPSHPLFYRAWHLRSSASPCLAAGKVERII